MSEYRELGTVILVCAITPHAQVAFSADEADRDRTPLNILSCVRLGSQVPIGIREVGEYGVMCPWGAALAGRNEPGRYKNFTKKMSPKPEPGIVRENALAFRFLEAKECFYGSDTRLWQRRKPGPIGPCFRNIGSLAGRLSCIRPNSNPLQGSHVPRAGLRG